MTAPTKVQLAKHHVEVATKYRGINRHDNKDQIARFLQLFGLDFADGNGTPYAFCAAGLGYAAVKAYCDLAQIPYTAANALKVFKGQIHAVDSNYFPIGTSCEDIRKRAVARGLFLSVDDMGDDVDLLPGWQVVFEFDHRRPGQASHIGIVTVDKNDDFDTLEFNTSGPHPGSEFNGGFVWSKTRGYTSALGFIRTY